MLAEYPDVVYAPEAWETPQARRIRLGHQAAAAQSLRPVQGKRDLILTAPDFLVDKLKSLHPIFHYKDKNPQSRSVAQSLEEVRLSIVAAYKKAEQNPMQITNLVAVKLCKSMARSFYRAACSLTMVNHIPCIRPLAPEIYKLAKEDPLIKDINERPPPAVKTQRAKRTSAKPTPSTSTSGTTGAAAKRKRGGAEPQAEAPKPATPGDPMDIDEAQCPSSPTDDAQARKRRKETT